MPPVRFLSETIEAWRAGTIGWIATRALLEVEGMPRLPTRSTLVLREEGAYWKVVQWHLSVPVAGKEALGIELTTSVDAILAMVENDASPIAATSANGEVTIVFTDLEGSTALMERLGEQTWLDLLEWHDRAVRRQTALFGGTVMKSQGDGFMLAFAAPGAATACAVAIEHAVSAGWVGISLAVRIGIHNGNAKAESGDFFGRTVVVATRIAGAASSGELLVSQSVQESLVGAFALGLPRSLFPKGLAGEHTAFPVIWD
jgi:class 3 adenylate cyclase